MEARLIAALIVSPFALAFVYAGIHEYMRYKAEGSATYGLAYDEETGTTRVTGIADGDEAYDHENFDPNDYNDPDIKDESDEDRV